jgi:UDP-N-acetylglucosamine--dolichyl-phosphate N-acetylglucosaminephosphotransferase
MEALIISLILALITAIIVAPPFIRRMHDQGFLGKDMNKYARPLVAELGGVIVFMGFSISIFASIFIATYLHWITIELSVLLGAFCTISTICFIGIVDDIVGWKKGIRQWQHALFPIIAALPLMAIQAGETTMAIPFLGSVDFGIFYALLIIPIGVTGASNAFNMLAGFNGLEAGQGIILTTTLTIVALLTGQTTAVVLGVAMIGALLGFLKFNWFPAKIFGGDSLTLMVGANLAVMSIVGNMESMGVVIFALFFIEFVIKAKHMFKSECFGIPNKKCELSANPKGGSLTQWIMKIGKGKLTEQKLVLIILSIQTLICTAALLFYLRLF